MKRTLIVCALAVAVITARPGPAQAANGDSGSNDLEDNLSSYTGRNAEGYLKPLQKALGQTLNSGIFMYAGVPKDGLSARLEIKGMIMSFKDEDRTFRATTEDYFGDPQTVNAPTVIGDGKAVAIMNPSTGAVGRSVVSFPPLSK